MSTLFISEQPTLRLFNIKNGAATFVRSIDANNDKWAVSMSTGIDLHFGSRLECEDFVWGLGGFVKAYNMTPQGNKNELR